MHVEVAFFGFTTKLTPKNKWYYPSEIANDLESLNMSTVVKQEVFACAWEYTRCVIPQYTNWKRYIAFMRIIIMGVIAEFKGSLVDVTAGDNILGYNLQEVLDDLFAGTADYENMCREYRSFLLITADKSSNRRNGFRMRDADALARFTIASALACNDLDSVKLSDGEYEILTEIGDTLYDAVAFFKHRSEGETNSTFAYMPSDKRITAFHQAREVLWALDVALSRRAEYTPVLNFVRFFGGPIHIMMRRYRFVEEELTIGRSETRDVVDQARKNRKLWYRVDSDDERMKDEDRFRHLVSTGSEIYMFPGLCGYLESDQNCSSCNFRDYYGAEAHGRFGGVVLCLSCRSTWSAHLDTLHERAALIFPELNEVFSQT
ncbi:hypothetical protein EJ05DRAFT_494378 [Pseudovirgaria hyperparasitica]|uniref:Uncharacterized protein n=1 Tax=Pseudovirgaria hyperparasitica TaxID=470096 RepID=A0A6A6VZ19_9PEZI|nr:uncharacterized protein EJ05DRAFT_494378 [Pseudovirgaria hyperparasitica]KAF2754940.1 hypothetical protein EJ05DRAFT_494378 [Pseudovirgaria hyperparasitica]